nr:MAG: replication polyprotein [Chemarfal virus 96]
MTDTVLDTVETQGVKGNTKTLTRSRGWCLTVNNYTEEEWYDLKLVGTQQTQKFCLGKETGAQGTPHIQGYLYFANARTFEQVKLMCGRAHWEKAKGNPSQNRDYCSKEGDYVEGGWPKAKIDPNVARRVKALQRYEDVEWRPFQKEILEYIDEEPDDRTVIWVVDKEGGKGKSYLAKYIYLNYPTIIADGKKDNVFNQLKTKLDGGMEPRVCLLDIPRCGQGYMNYGVIEQIKNGLIYSGKYEGGDCIFDPPHVVVFANFDPDYSQFTGDRWKVIDLGERAIDDLSL